MKSLSVLSSVMSFVAVAHSLAYGHDPFDAASYARNDIIRRDVAVIGGGATGTYAAIKLGDMGKSVVLVERSGRLGGQAETYTDPTTGTKVDYGVTAYYNNSIVTDFFDRFEVPIVKFSFGSTAIPVFADFAAGTLLSNFTPSPLNAEYVTELHKYPYLDNGYHLPDPVPSDLLLTWPEYLEKYSIQDIGQPTLSRATGSGNPLDILAIYIFTAINQALLNEVAGAAITTARHDCSELFEKALLELGTNALLGSTVIAAQRPKNGSDNVKLVVQTPTGRKLIIASQLILAIPPILDNMGPFSLDRRERGTISQLVGHPYYAGLVSNTGLAAGHSYNNVGANTPYNVPTLPGAAMFSPTLEPGVFLYWYTSLTPLSQSQVQSAISTTLKGLQKATGGNDTTPTHLAWGDHSPFHLSVSADAIANGWYDDMYGLQGYRNTWYIGALFVLSSGQLWNETAKMLPDIVAAIK